MKKERNVFVNGPVSPQFIGESVAKHCSKTTIGAHDIFLGQVRSDLIRGKTVTAIEYSAYQEMANEVFHSIREEAFSKFELTCMHIYHSIGVVRAGEICLFVFTSSPHRKMAFDACRWIVEEIKERSPIFGKELFEDDTYTWKINTP